ncbi:MAG: hypothetical protein ABL999_09480 [Pyrinomonadaceae bacterium]
MKKPVGLFAMFVFACFTFFAIVPWHTGAQRLVENKAPLSLSPVVQKRILADRQSEVCEQTDLTHIQSMRPEVGTIVYAYDYFSNRVVSFEASAPGTYLTDVVLTGIDIQNDEFLSSIDFRPFDGKLYGVASKSVSRSR